MYVRLPVLESYIRLCPVADVRLDLQRLQRRGWLACDSHRYLHDPVRRGSLPADAYLPDTPGSKCGAGLPAMALGINTTLQAVAANANHDAKRAALDLDLLLILGAPLNHAGRNSTGIWGVNRQGCRFSRPAPWMARGGGPPNQCRITGTPSLGEVPSGGARAFCLLLRCSKVSRCKSGTISSRYPNNGYVPSQPRPA